jgi:hypothetical protein
VPVGSVADHVGYAEVSAAIIERVAVNVINDLARLCRDDHPMQARENTLAVSLLRGGKINLRPPLTAPNWIPMQRLNPSGVFRADPHTKLPDERDRNAFNL